MAGISSPPLLFIQTGNITNGYFLKGWTAGRILQNTGRHLVIGVILIFGCQLIGENLEGGQSLFLAALRIDRGFQDLQTDPADAAGEETSDLVIAVPGGRGTGMMMDLAHAVGVPVARIELS